MGFKNLLSRVSGVDTKDGKIIAELAFETGRRIAYQYLLGYRMAEQTYPNFSDSWENPNNMLLLWPTQC